MRTPFAWTLPLQTSLQVLCACYAIWGVPVAALATPEQTPPPVSTSEQSTAPATTQVPAAAKSPTDNESVQVGGGRLDRRVLALLAMGCVVGLIAGWARAGPNEPRVRLLVRQKKTHLSVLVPPGPTPRLIPSESPNAKRARPARAPVPRQTPECTTRSGIIDYIAAFADPAGVIDERRVDYLLESGESAEKPVDSPEESDGSLRHTG